MHLRHPTRLLAVSVVLLACGDSAGPSHLDRTFAFSDPTGDTAFLKSRGTYFPDLVAVRGGSRNDSLYITLVFRDVVRPVSEGGTQSIGGLLALDVDENAATGELVQDAVGADYRVLFSDSAGVSVNLARHGATGSSSSTRIPATYRANTLGIVIPLDIILLQSTGRMRIAGNVSTLDGVGDIFPDSGYWIVPYVRQQ